MSSNTTGSVNPGLWTCS